MAISFHAPGTLVDTTGTSFTVPQPTFSIGDWIIVYVVQDAGGTNVISPPTDLWYKFPLEDNASTHNRTTVFYHTITTATESAWTFTTSTSTRNVAVAISYSGVASIDICSWAEGPSGGPAVASTATVADAGDTVICAITSYGVFGNTIALDAALTSRFNSTTGDTHYTIAIGDATGPAAGGTTTAYSNTLAVGGGQQWHVPVICLSGSGAITKSSANIGAVPTGTSTGGNGVSVAATVPAGIQNGDILVAFLAVLYASTGSNTQTTITAPAGWTMVNENYINGDNTSTPHTYPSHVGLYTHAVTNVGTEPATYSWTFAGGSLISSTSVDMIAVRGCNQLDTYQLSTSASPTLSLPLVGITTINDNEPLLNWAAWVTNAGGPAQTLDTQQLETTSPNQSHTLWSGLGNLAGTVSPTRTVTTTLGAGNACAGYCVGFIPSTTNDAQIVSTSVVSHYSAVASIAITTPSSIAVNDLLIAHVSGPTGGTITAPAGWSAITNASADDGTFLAKCFSRVVDGTEGGTMTFSFSANATGGASIIAFRNVGTSSFLASNTTTAGQTPALGNIKQGSIVLMYQANTQNTPSPPNAMWITPFVYTATTNSMALSVMLKTASDGGYLGKQYRSEAGLVSGPSITLAIVGLTPPTPPPTPKPLPPPGPSGPSFPLPFRGLLATLPSFPPVHDNEGRPLHEVNLLLNQKLSQLLTLHNQLVRYASNPQLHYKPVAIQPLDTAQQDALLTPHNIGITTTAGVDTLPSYQDSGYTTTNSPIVTATNVTWNTGATITIGTATPQYTINQGDMIVVNASAFLAGGALAHQLIDVLYTGSPSGTVYGGTTTTVNSAGDMIVSSTFVVAPGTPIVNDTGVTLQLTQNSGGNVTLSSASFTVGNISTR